MTKNAKIIIAAIIGVVAVAACVITLIVLNPGNTNKNEISTSELMSMSDSKLAEYFYELVDSKNEPKCTDSDRALIDDDNEEIDINALNSVNKIKEELDKYFCRRTLQNRSVRTVTSSISEDTTNYIYTHVYFMTSYGDWGLSDNIRLYEETLRISKGTGKYFTTEKLLRQVDGNYHSEPEAVYPAR